MVYLSKMSTKPSQDSQSNVASSSHASNEDKDKKIAEERSVAAQKLQRKQRLEAMVAKRNTNLNYLKV